MANPGRFCKPHADPSTPTWSGPLGHFTRRAGHTEDPRLGAPNWFIPRGPFWPQPSPQSPRNFLIRAPLSQEHPPQVPASRAHPASTVQGQGRRDPQNPEEQLAEDQTAGEGLPPAQPTSLTVEEHPLPNPTPPSSASRAQSHSCPSRPSFQGLAGPA